MSTSIYNSTNTVLKSMAIIIFTLSFIIGFWKLVAYTQNILKKYLNWIAIEKQQQQQQQRHVDRCALSKTKGILWTQNYISIRVYIWNSFLSLDVNVTTMPLFCMRCQHCFHFNMQFSSEFLFFFNQRRRWNICNL